MNGAHETATEPEGEIGVVLEEELDERLELNHRNLVQINLLSLLPHVGDDTMQAEYLIKHGKEISDVIDGSTEVGEQIRRLARAGEYEQAAKLLLPLVPQSV